MGHSSSALFSNEIIIKIDIYIQVLYLWLSRVAYPEILDKDVCFFLVELLCKLEEKSFIALVRCLGEIQGWE